MTEFWNCSCEITATGKLAVVLVKSLFEIVAAVLIKSLFEIVAAVLGGPLFGNVALATYVLPLFFSVNKIKIKQTNLSSF